MRLFYFKRDNFIISFQTYWDKSFDREYWDFTLIEFRMGTVGAVYNLELVLFNFALLVSYSRS